MLLVHEYLLLKEDTDKKGSWNSCSLTASPLSKARLSYRRNKPGVDGRLGSSTSPCMLPKPLNIRVLHLRPGFYAHNHRLARRSQRPPKKLCLVGEGVHHLLVAVYPLGYLMTPWSLHPLSSPRRRCRQRSTLPPSGYPKQKGPEPR